MAIGANRAELFLIFKLKFQNKKLVCSKIDYEQTTFFIFP